MGEGRGGDKKINMLRVEVKVYSFRAVELKVVCDHFTDIHTIREIPGEGREGREVWSASCQYGTCS